MERLTSQQMAEVALAALVNARRLHDDAVSLRLGDRLPSAFILAGLALDELGKHVLVSSFYVRDQTDQEWRKFWRRFRKHQSKLDDALLNAWAGDLLSEDPPADAAEFHQERLAATYVDVDRDDGTVTAPSQVVMPERVDEVMSLLQRELGFCESMVGQMTPSQFAAELESMRTSTLGQETRRLIDEVGQEAAMAFAVATRAGVPRAIALKFAQELKDSFGGPSPDDEHSR